MPKIMSESVGVSPIVVMFAVFAGGELFGLPGLLLGIPAAALAKVAWRFFRSDRSAAAAGVRAPEIAFGETPFVSVSVTSPDGGTVDEPLPSRVR
ncbi:MAG: hypothetical protein PVSMB8_05420 [Vulcanimicrobiaceae bacterium]